MSDDRDMFSAAPMNILPQENYQMVSWKPLPSDQVLQEIGRLAIRLGQLEHLLKLIYKRTDSTISFNDSLDLTFSLGALLDGVHGGKIVGFIGLRKLAERNCS